MAIATWIAAFGSVVTFYAHALIGRPAAEVTPVITFVVASSIAALGAFGFLTMKIVRAGTAARQMSITLMLIAIGLGFISTLSGLTRDPMSPADLGVFAIQIITPVMLTFCINRIDLLRAICRLAIVFALADFIVNVASYMGIANLSSSVGDRGDYGLHFLGLPGNSFAEGIVAFLAITYVASGVPTSLWSRWRGVRIALIAVLFVSEWLIRARTDLALSVFSVSLLVYPKSSSLPMIGVALIISSALIAGAFLPNLVQTDETLRQDLIMRGAKTALGYPLLGEGSRYHATADLTSNYRALSRAGVTESGALDFAIAYGIPATVCFYLSAFFALASTRVRQTLPAVLLACLTGSLAITGALASFLGSIVFYLALILCQREEWWLLQSGSRRI